MQVFPCCPEDEPCVPPQVRARGSRRVGFHRAVDGGTYILHSFLRDLILAGSSSRAACLAKLAANTNDRCLQRTSMTGLAFTATIPASIHKFTTIRVFAEPSRHLFKCDYRRVGAVVRARRPSIWAGLGNSQSASPSAPSKDVSSVQLFVLPALKGSPSTMARRSERCSTTGTASTRDRPRRRRLKSGHTCQNYCRSVRYQPQGLRRTTTGPGVPFLAIFWTRGDGDYRWTHVT
ncbi:hypothetical protein BD413DRAFT_31142 [Trametes elegans]|nr:hypothetical protein BD413DRAFT_31142 [Trametes elegans]